MHEVDVESLALWIRMETPADIAILRVTRSVRTLHVNLDEAMKQNSVSGRTRSEFLEADGQNFRNPQAQVARKLLMGRHARWKPAGRTIVSRG
jgi:hypothetical protein